MLYCLLSAYFTVRICIVAFTRCTTSGPRRSVWLQSTLIPWSTSSATCCRQFWVRCSWAHTLPPRCCSLSSLWSRQLFHTADITFRSCRLQRPMTSIIRSKCSCELLVFSMTFPVIDNISPKLHENLPKIFFELQKTCEQLAVKTVSATVNRGDIDKKCVVHTDLSTTLECSGCWIVCTALTRCFVRHVPISVTWCCSALYLYPFSFLTTWNSSAKHPLPTVWTKTRTEVVLTSVNDYAMMMPVFSRLIRLYCIYYKAYTFRILYLWWVLILNCTFECVDVFVFCSDALLSLLCKWNIYQSVR